jgi:acetyltransferase-like isoleucine patch superfamily enzyme
MGAYCVIGHADIGPGVRIGSRVSIPSGKRQHLDAAGRLSSSERFDTVAVGEGSWIGEGAILLAKVGYGCIVSAGAVVTTAVPDRSVVGGNPARVLRGPR